ncbi:hypothetical protein EV2_020593 [Malus domestica]
MHLWPEDIFTKIQRLLIYPKIVTWEDHRRHIAQVLKVIQKNQLQLNGKKSEFEKQHLVYLGFIIGMEELKVDPEKVQIQPIVHSKYTKGATNGDFNSLMPSFNKEGLVVVFYATHRSFSSESEVYICYYSKMVILIPCKQSITGEGVAKLFFQHVETFWLTYIDYFQQR